MDLNVSTDEIIIVPSSPPSALDPETPKRSTSKVRLPKVESAQRKSERDAKRAEEEAVKAEKKRQKDELKAKRAEELQQEKARKAEELQQEKVRRAEEKAKKAEEQLLEKARKAEELQQEKARKAEELQQEKARKAEEKAKKEAENADKKAELKQKKEQKQAAAQKQELVNKQMANYMGKFFKPIEKSTTKDGQNNNVNGFSIPQRSTEEFDEIVSKQDTQFVSNLLDEIKTMKKIEHDFQFRTRLNSDSNSLSTFTTTNNAFIIKTRYLHFPEKYFNRPPYYGSFKKALAVYIDPLKPDASIDNVDYSFDSEAEWEEPCKDGEEIRSDAEDLSDSEAMDSDSDSDSFIVPHGHLSDDELNEDEQQQSTSTKQAREAAKSHVWDKKVARRTQQKELKPIFGCISDLSLDEKLKSEFSTFLHQFRRIFVPKELCLRVEDDEQHQQNGDETTTKEEKTKRVSKKKSLISKKGLATNDSTTTPTLVTVNSPTTAKRTGSASNIVEGASPSKRRKTNLNENSSILVDEFDVQMTDVESFATTKSNVLDEVKSSTPLTIIANDATPPSCTLLIPKRKSTAI